MKWIRVRFLANPDDPRPVHWRPPGPYWITGSTDEHSVIVAYVRKLKQVTRYWPEATEIEDEPPCDEIIYSDRFPKPDWYHES